MMAERCRESECLCVCVSFSVVFVCVCVCVSLCVVFVCVCLSLSVVLVCVSLSLLCDREIEQMETPEMMAEQCRESEWILLGYFCVSLGWHTG